MPSKKPCPLCGKQIDFRRTRCQQCRNNWLKANPKMHEGVCPTCKKPFASKHTKKYCSLPCYHASPDFIECVRLSLEKRGSEWGKRIKFVCQHCKKEFAVTPSQAMGSGNRSNKFCSLSCYRKHPNKLRRGPYAPRVELTCLQCRNTFDVLASYEESHHPKFCNWACRRKYFSERFDRFIASPESVVAMQNFDEYLLQEDLPCLFEGCDWSGIRLGMHVNIVHGVPAQDFKAMVGFNRGTPLVGSQFLETIKGKPAGDHLPKTFPDSTVETRGKYERRLEHKQHLKKIWALKREGLL